MRAEVLATIEEIKKSLQILAERKNLNIAKERLLELQSITSDASFWEDRKRARLLMQERQNLENFLELIISIETQLTDNI